MSCEPTTAESPASVSSGSWSGVMMSLAFWLTLLVAAGLFGAVSLSPKLAAYLSLQDRYYAQQLELVQLEQQQRELERVITSMKEDPQFAAELARLEFDAVRPGEEILSVDSALTLDPKTPTAKPVIARAPEAAIKPWVTLLAERQPLRIGLLGCAALLVLLAFGWLQDVAADQVQSGCRGLRTGTAAIWRRYVRPSSGL